MQRYMQADSLAEARRRFERWRKTRGSGGRIPHELWMAAGKAAAAHDAESVAAELGLDPERLRYWSRVAAADPAENAPATFVELPPRADFVGMANTCQAAECLLELEEPSGRRLRIALKGAATTQVLELGRVLWRATP